MIEHRRTTSNKCEGCRCSLNGSSVVLTDHVIKRMTERSVSMTEMIEALRFGRVSVDEHGVSVFTLQEDKYEWCCTECEVWVDDPKSPQHSGCLCKQPNLEYAIRQHGNLAPKNHRLKSNRTGVCVVAEQLGNNKVVLITTYRPNDLSMSIKSTEGKKRLKAAAELVSIKLAKCA